MRISRHGSTLVVETPAKLNLSLKVLGQRSDGFHELHSLMVSVRLYDTICFEPRATNEVELSITALTPSASEIPVDSRNLVVRAAKLLQEISQTEFGARIHLTKRIPCEAGMGGGSSDAAATLICLNQLWNLNLSGEQLHELAAELGSDLNFFIDSTPAAVCTGRGEHISPIPVNRSLSFVVVKPNSGLSTADVFKHWATLDQHGTDDVSNIEEAIQSGQLQHIAERVSNDLQQPARELNDEIDKTLILIAQSNVVATGMTGSGSACFGLCRSWRHANRIAAKLRSQNNQHVWVVKSGV